MPLPERVSDLAAYDLLLSVASLGSVGAAARAHGVSQPAASSRLRHLERRLGLQLLERSPRGSRLTEHGALVADWARTAVDAAASLDAGVTSLRGTAESRLRVAASMTVAEYLLPQWLLILRAGAPRTTVALTAGNSEDVAAAVLAGEVHLGFVEGPDVPRGLVAQPVAHDELTVVVAPSHRWARRRSGIGAAELAATPWSAVNEAPARAATSSTPWPRGRVSRSPIRSSNSPPPPPSRPPSPTASPRPSSAPSPSPRNSRAAASSPSPWPDST